MSLGLVLRGLLLMSDRVARFKRFLTSSAPFLVSEAANFQWLRCLLLSWIRAYARIWAACWP